MSKFGFKFMKVEEPEVEELENLEVEEDVEEDNSCIFCGKITDLVVEIETNVKILIPVCKSHAHRFKTKEKTILKLLGAIEEVIAS